MNIDLLNKTKTKLQANGKTDEEIISFFNKRLKNYEEAGKKGDAFLCFCFLQTLKHN